MHESVNNLLNSDSLNVNQVAICIEMSVICKYSFCHVYLIECFIHGELNGRFVQPHYAFRLRMRKTDH